MRLGLDAVFFAVLQAQVGRGAAVDPGAVLGVARLALLGLEVAPVEGQRGQVEAVCEVFLVCLVLFLGLHLAQHEEVRAVLEVMRPLMDFGVRARDGIAFLIHEAQVGVGLAVHLDAAGHAVVHIVGVLDKGLEYLFSAVAHGVFPPAYSSILKDFAPFLVR